MTATLIELRVVGLPQPQGSKTGFVINGRAVLVEGRRKGARAAFASWRQLVATAAHDWALTHDHTPLDDPVAVTIAFELPRPASAPKRVAYPARKPDIDKLARAVLDAITGTLVADDARIVDLSVTKRFARTAPGATITINPVAGVEAHS